MQPTQDLFQLNSEYREQVTLEVEILFAVIKGVVRELEDDDSIVNRQLAMGLYHQFWRLRKTLEPIID